MIEVKQTKLHDPENGVNGNCWRACIASILSLPIDDVPAFEDEEKFDFESLRDWLREIDATMVCTLNPKRHEPRGYTIAVGWSPRFEGVLHCVVAWNGKLIHDPHPDNTFLNGEPIEWWSIIGWGHCLNDSHHHYPADKLDD